MKKLLSILFALMLSMSMTSCLGIERVDAGCEGIEVSLYGDDRGIGEINLVTGWVIYNSFTKQIYEYPTWVQTVDYEPFSINAKDGPLFTIDPNVNIKIEDGKAPQVFKKYRKELNDVINGPVLKYIKDACRIEINKFTTDEIVSNREKIEDAIEKRLKTTLAKELADELDIKVFGMDRIIHYDTTSAKRRIVRRQGLVIFEPPGEAVFRNDLLCLT